MRCGHQPLAQQPNRKLVTGTITANLPAYTALKTGSAIESRMMLESDGAERLLGHGDLLYNSVGNPVLAQVLFMSAATKGAQGAAEPS